MRTTTTAVLAVGATALAIPTAAARADVQSSVQVPLAGHLTVASQMRGRAHRARPAAPHPQGLAARRQVADVRDRGFSPRAYRRRVNDDPPATLARRVRDLRRDLHAARRAERRRAAASRLAPPPRSRRSPPASPAATPARTPATGSTASTSSRSQTWAERRRQRQPRGGQRGRAEPPRGDALRARGRLALAGLRPLVVSKRMALRDEFPVLERVAYLNAGTDGPIPRAADRAGRSASSTPQLEDGRTVAALRAPACSCRPTCAPATRS